MANFYSNLAAVASRLLADKGQTVTFSRRIQSIFSAGSGEYTGGRTDTWSGSGVAFNYNKAEIDGSTIQSGDLRLIVEAVETEPRPGDKVAIGGVDYHVVSVVVSSPAGTPTHYETQVRR